MEEMVEKRGGGERGGKEKIVSVKLQALRNNTQTAIKM